MNRNVQTPPGGATATRSAIRPSLGRLMVSATALSLSIAAAPADVEAQQGIASFEERTHNFGVIEEGAEAAHTFTFTNTGDAPLTLVRVRPACGCTTPAWTQEAISPGEAGYVTAVYHSAGRPGPFNKSIAVYTDGNPDVLQLWISGDVSPIRLEGTTIGNLIVTDEVRFPRISPEAPAVVSFRIQNAGDRPLRIDSVATETPLLFTNYGERVLEPGQTDEVTVILETDALRSGDRVSHAITLWTNDEAKREKRISITGLVE